MAHQNLSLSAQLQGHAFSPQTRRAFHKQLVTASLEQLLALLIVNFSSVNIAVSPVIAV